MCRVQTVIMYCKNDDVTEMATLTGILLSTDTRKVLTVDEKKYLVINIDDVIKGDTVTREVSVVDYIERGKYIL